MLEVPGPIWASVYQQLKAAGYSHALDDQEKIIDMTGIGLVPSTLEDENDPI